MSASIKPIEAKSVHQIQSGQVIVDLCSVVKELVENSLDANATIIEVRFKNYGLDSIEVQDNGTGIAEANYESLALKHHTSKLSSYEDLSSLNTFGFRGEALSSLCALSNFSVTTAQAHEIPKGKCLKFETSGKLQSATIVAAQRGTTAMVENLFDKLPVRRKELTKNVKREYGKVLGLLHAYACIAVKVKITVKNAMPKAKSATVFSTNGNVSTRDNIANVYGAKTLVQLIPLDLILDFSSNSARKGQDVDALTKVSVSGHISRPVFGEGRQTPDRQMFFVNGRPCGLPQIAKAFNEVYKSYNVSQSPFVFADLLLDTSAYDVNVSPDKRTIFLHDATALTEQLKIRLAELFDQTDYTVPQAQLQPTKTPIPYTPTVRRDSAFQSTTSGVSRDSDQSSSPSHAPDDKSAFRAVNVSREGDSGTRSGGFETHVQSIASIRPDRSNLEPISHKSSRARTSLNLGRRTETSADDDVRQSDSSESDDDPDSGQGLSQENENESEEVQPVPLGRRTRVRDFNARIEEERNPFSRDGTPSHHGSQERDSELSSPAMQERNEGGGVVQRAMDRMRPRRAPAEVAEFTIGDRTITRVIGSHAPGPSSSMHRSTPDIKGSKRAKNPTTTRFSHALRRFDASQHVPSDEGETQDDKSDEETESEDDDELDRSAMESAAVHQIHDASGLDRSPSKLGTDDENNSEDADLDFIKDSERKAEENARVARLIQLAEEHAIRKGKESHKRVTQSLRGTPGKDTTASQVLTADWHISMIEEQAERWKEWSSKRFTTSVDDAGPADTSTQTEEERLSLTVSIDDFAQMHVAGQFNLGFIIAVRWGNFTTKLNHKDEVFIIDQHASDEKYNFERLQTETVVGNQRLVHPVTLDLTAVEEEIVLENQESLEKNGFLVDVNTSGERPVGQRCRLVSLPLSKEVVFNTKDLDELIHLLGESPVMPSAKSVPRPSKVRRIFAMRACRSSIMIGKGLSKKQMSTVLQHMGSIDKPWNCPHGRPTMRHVTCLNDLDVSLWHEGDGVCSGAAGPKPVKELWHAYAG